MGGAGQGIPVVVVAGPGLRSLPSRGAATRRSRHCFPRFWTPIVDEDGDDLVIRCRYDRGGDALARHGYSASAAWSVTRGRPDWAAGYAYARWRPTFSPTCLGRPGTVQGRRYSGPRVQRRRAGELPAGATGADPRDAFMRPGSTSIAAMPDRDRRRRRPAPGAACGIGVRRARAASATRSATRRLARFPSGEWTARAVSGADGDVGSPSWSTCEATCHSARATPLLAVVAAGADAWGDRGGLQRLRARRQRGLRFGAMRRPSMRSRIRGFDIC